MKKEHQKAIDDKVRLTRERDKLSKELSASKKNLQSSLDREKKFNDSRKTSTEQIVALEKGKKHFAELANTRLKRIEELQAEYEAYVTRSTTIHERKGDTETKC